MGGSVSLQGLNVNVSKTDPEKLTEVNAAQKAVFEK